MLPLTHWKKDGIQKQTKSLSCSLFHSTHGILSCVGGVWDCKWRRKREMKYMSGSDHCIKLCNATERLNSIKSRLHFLFVF